MDDTQNANSKTQIANQDAGQQNSSGQKAPPQTQPIQPTQSQQTQVGSLQKERLPVSAPVQEVMQPTEQAPRISPELAEAGVEAVSQTPQLTKDHAQLGITHAKESVPMPSVPSNAANIQYPMTQQQALSVPKKVSNSIAWLATLIIRQFKMKNTKA